LPRTVQVNWSSRSEYDSPDWPEFFLLKRYPATVTELPPLGEALGPQGRSILPSVEAALSAVDLRLTMRRSPA
jgi:hypothetical protein